MALMKSGTVPQDAVILDENEASSYAWDIVTKWATFKDSWALRYGPGFLGGVNALSGILINKHYRHKLKLGTYGYLASVIPISVMPGVLTSLFHRYVITKDMLLMKNETCPICFEVKSALIQSTLGLVYPTILASASTMMLANRYSTCRIPNLLEGPKVIYTFWIKITRPYASTFLMLGVFQLFASSVTTYFEMRNNIIIRKKLMVLEEKILAKEQNKS